MSAMDKDARISRFWDKFTDKTIAYGVKKDNVRWYVKHAELYIKSQNTRLALHTPQTIDNYLEVKGRNTRLKDWMFCQIIDSLRILFVDDDNPSITDTGISCTMIYDSK